jgi:[acyl-carrier-protein] S-malonyltransferase
MQSNLGFVFPGQGSQSVGMLAELAERHALVQEVFDEASEALERDLWHIVSNGPQELLNSTVNTQPAMLAAGVAVWRIWQAQGGATPTVMAGHSLGEYSALVCAGALEFGQAVRLVEERARLMQAAVPAGEGGMAAILGLDDDAVRALCEQAAQGEVLEAVNFNSPGQVVIAGSAAAVERAVQQAPEAGAKRAVPLPVSVPSHCQLMRPAAERLLERLQQTPFAAPEIPVLHNVHVAAESDADGIREALARQLYSPVRWVETIEKMINDGARKLIECGPGKVLTGLNKRINRKVPTLPVYDTASLTAALAGQ